MPRDVVFSRIMPQLFLFPQGKTTTDSGWYISHLEPEEWERGTTYNSTKSAQISYCLHSLSRCQPTTTNFKAIDSWEKGIGFFQMTVSLRHPPKIETIGPLVSCHLEFANLKAHKSTRLALIFLSARWRFLHISSSKVYQNHTIRTSNSREEEKTRRSWYSRFWDAFW